jgi:large subunit ribosomal protein L28
LIKKSVFSILLEKYYGFGLSGRRDGLSLSDLRSSFVSARYNSPPKSRKEPRMARKCAISGKGPMSGNNVSHAKNRTKRRFLPNLRTVRITLEDGTTKKIKISAKELRTLKKES